MKSNTLIEKQIKRKTNPTLVETVIACKKNAGWKEVASLLTGPSRKKSIVNLDRLNSEKADKIVVAGKVLGFGSLDKKMKIVAISASDSAMEKIKKAGAEFVYIMDEINKNPEAKGLTILR